MAEGEANSGTRNMVSPLTTPRRRRGPYRCKRRTPRQTIHSRSRRINLSITRDDISPIPQSTINEDDEDSPDPANVSNDSNHPKLYPGSILTSRSSELAISSYISRHHLSRQAQEDLLRLLQLHIPESRLIPSSVYSLKINSSLDEVVVQHAYHYFCPRCHKGLSDSECEVCPNDECATSLDYSSISGFFTLSIAGQLQNLLRSEWPCVCNIIFLLHMLVSGPGLYQSLLQTKMKTPKPGKIADICDGQLYKKLVSENGPLANKSSISVVLNTDGVVVFKSTNYSIWPVLLMINELPFNER